MPRRRRMARSSVVTPNLTPLLDVVLQLITFFMMLVHLGARLEDSANPVRPPLVPAARPSSDPAFDRLSVALDSQGRLLIAGNVLDEKATAAWWAAQAKTRRAALETLRSPAASAN